MTCSAASYACEKCEQRAEALQLFDDMQESSLQLNVITHNATISTCEWYELGSDSTSDMEGAAEAVGEPVQQQPEPLPQQPHELQ